MTNIVAMLVHQVMDEPDRWSVKDGVLTDGYHKLALDSSRYALGEASYIPTQANADILRKAVAYWKAETGWRPPEQQASYAPIKEGSPTDVDGVMRNAYEKFVKSVRSNHKSFQIHGDSHIMNLGLSKALKEFDEAVAPFKLRGSASDANASGVSST